VSVVAKCDGAAWYDAISTFAPAKVATAKSHVPMAWELAFAITTFGILKLGWWKVVDAGISSRRQ